MGTRSEIPDIVIGRLPVYLRSLRRLHQDNREITSSHELGQRLGISSAQIRKDLSHFGEFGKQGTGYHVESLIKALERILNVDHEWRVALVGVGNLGRAIAHYGGFTAHGFRIAHVFDVDPGKIGEEVVPGLIVKDIDNLRDDLHLHQIQLVMLATPAETAQDVADLLVECGVKAILNYAPIIINVPDDVHVQYIDPIVHLQRMTYYLE